MASTSLTSWLNRVTHSTIPTWFESPKKVLKQYIQPGTTVLDVGCGSGVFSAGLVKLVGREGHVIALDFEKKNVDSVKQMAARSGLTGRLKVRHCTEDDLQAGHVDTALAACTIRKVEDKSRLLGSVHRALRPGGTLLVLESRSIPAEASDSETATSAQSVGFELLDHPESHRYRMVRFRKN